MPKAEFKREVTKHLTGKGPAEFLAARQGDRAAIARLRALRQQLALQGQDQSGWQARASRSESSGMSSVSFLGFHPSLKRRLKRLERMGAHVGMGAARSKAWVVSFVLSLIFAPFLLQLVALFLLLIAIMIMPSLTFLVIWLAVIHGTFAMLARH